MVRKGYGSYEELLKARKKGKSPPKDKKGKAAPKGKPAKGNKK